MMEGTSQGCTDHLWGNMRSSPSLHPTVPFGEGSMTSQTRKSHTCSVLTSPYPQLAMEGLSHEVTFSAELHCFLRSRRSSLATALWTDTGIMKSHPFGFPVTTADSMFAGVLARAGPRNDCTERKGGGVWLIFDCFAKTTTVSVPSSVPSATSDPSTMISLSLWLDSLIDDFNFTEAFTMAGWQGKYWLGRDHLKTQAVTHQCSTGKYVLFLSTWLHGLSS